jgi:acyl-CoA hydrolase
MGATIAAGMDEAGATVATDISGEDVVTGAT